MMFIQNTQDCQHCSRESQFQLARKPQIRFASGGFASCTPNGALPLYPAGGLGGPQTPRLLGGLQPPVLPTSFNSPPISSHFDNPGPVRGCGSKFLVRLANHLAQVHKLSDLERQYWLQFAKLQNTSMVRVYEKEVEAKTIFL